MPVTRPTPQSFVVVDLEGAERADGIVRCARKILRDGAVNLARSRSYAWASLGERISGASAGINAEASERDEAVAAFADAVAADSATVALDPGKGVEWSDLTPLLAADWRSTLVAGDAADATRRTLLAAGVVAAAESALGALDGRTIVVEGHAAVRNQLSEAFRATGATVRDDVEAPLAEAADVLCCGSSVGMIDHVAASSLGASVVVPWGTMPVTTRALAVSRRAGTTVLPDFVTTLGPLVGSLAGPSEDLAAVDARVRSLVASIVEEVLGHDEGPLVGACVRAESFMATWQEALPFGRPIA